MSAYAISPGLANRRLSINDLGSRAGGSLDAFGAGIAAATAAAAAILAPTAAAGRGLALGRGFAELADPGRAMGVMAHQDVATHDADHLFDVQRVGDGAGHARADRHGKEAGIEPVPVG